MDHESRYFDHAATTPLDPRVLEAMLPFLREEFGNANSLHSWGTRAHEAVETARFQVAELIGADDPSQVSFTSGAGEANNWLVRSVENGLYSPFEHSTLKTAAEARGWQIWENEGTALKANRAGVDVASLMAVNNEVGTLWDIRREVTGAQLLHVDATQAVGKLPFSVTGLDFASMSAHKINGPKGVGALFSATSAPSPLIFGGEQEQGLRGGTLNVPAIVGFGAAAVIAGQELDENLAKATELRSLILEELRHLSDWEILGGPKTSPFILGVSFAGVEGEMLVIDADRKGFAISSGAACSSRSTEPSHVLQALGLREHQMRGTVRISFGKGNSLDSTLSLARSLAQTVEMLRTMTRGGKNAQRSSVH